MTSDTSPETCTLPLVIQDALHDAVTSGIVMDLQFCFGGSRRLYGSRRVLSQLNSAYLNTLIDNEQPSPKDIPDDSDTEDQDREFESEDRQTNQVLRRSHQADNTLPKAGTASPTAYNPFHVISMRNRSYRTWRSFLQYLHSGKVEFASLMSQKNSNLQDPTICSPKSMYRLADQVGIESLKQLALSAIVERVTVDNILEELFCTFTMQFVTIQDLQISFLSENFSRVKGHRLIDGDLSGKGMSSVFMKLLLRKLPELPPQDSIVSQARTPKQRTPVASLPSQYFGHRPDYQTKNSPSLSPWEDAVRANELSPSPMLTPKSLSKEEGASPHSPMQAFTDVSTKVPAPPQWQPSPRSSRSLSPPPPPAPDAHDSQSLGKSPNAGQTPSPDIQADHNVPVLDPKDGVPEARPNIDSPGIDSNDSFVVESSLPVSPLQKQPQLGSPISPKAKVVSYPIASPGESPSSSLHSRELGQPAQAQGPETTESTLSKPSEGAVTSQTIPDPVHSKGWQDISNTAATTVIPPSAVSDASDPKPSPGLWGWGSKLAAAATAPTSQANVPVAYTPGQPQNPWGAYMSSTPPPSNSSTPARDTTATGVPTNARGLWGTKQPIIASTTAPPARPASAFSFGEPTASSSTRPTSLFGTTPASSQSSISTLVQGDMPPSQVIYSNPERGSNHESASALEARAGTAMNKKKKKGKK